MRMTHGRRMLPTLCSLGLLAACAEEPPSGGKAADDLSDVAPGPGAGKADRVRVRPIACGEAQTHSVTRRVPYLTYAFAGHAGQVVDVRVDRHGDGRRLDPVVGLFGPDGRALGVNDDCDANTLDACLLEVALPADGEYSIVSSTYRRRGAGPLSTSLACRDGEDAAIPVPIDRLDVASPLLPADETLGYRAFVGPAAGEAVRPGESLVARIASTPEGRRIDVEVDGNAAATGFVLTDDDGQTLDGFDGFPAGGDLLDVLPPAGTSLAIGVPYESAPPTRAYVEANHAQGSWTLDQRVVATPIAMWSLGDARLVRVETRAFHRLTLMPEDAGDLSGAVDPIQIELPAASLGVTDLLAVEGRGWRVLRFVRFLGLEADVDPQSLTVAQARGLPHAELTGCIASSSLVDDVLNALHPVGLAEVPEFARCARN